MYAGTLERQALGRRSLPPSSLSFSTLARGKNAVWETYLKGEWGPVVRRVLLSPHL
jgi:hypothetical protein